jgi:hypothetical protein
MSEMDSVAKSVDSILVLVVVAWRKKDGQLSLTEVEKETRVTNECGKCPW